MKPDYPLGQTLDFKIYTARNGPKTLSGSPVVVVYEDNSTTEITVGETLTVDFDSRTGLNNLRIVATSGNGYESGKSYAAVLTVGTVDGVSVVGAVLAQFSIERSPALRPAVAGRTIGVEPDGDLTKVNTLNGHTAQTGDAFGRIGVNGAGLSNLATAASIAALNDLDAAGIRAAVGLAAANLDMQLALLAGFVDTEIGTIQTSIDGLNDLDAAGIRAAVGLAVANLDTLISALATAAAAAGIQAKTDLLNSTIAGHIDVNILAIDNQPISKGGSDPSSPVGIT